MKFEFCFKYLVIDIPELPDIQLVLVLVLILVLVLVLSLVDNPLSIGFEDGDESIVSGMIMERDPKNHSHS